MKPILFLLWLLTGTTVYSQILTLSDPVSANTYNAEKYSGVSGTPFLYDKWIPGSVTIQKGTYNNLQLKFDVYGNTIYFNKDDNMYEFQEDVLSFVLMPAVSDSSTYQYYKKGISGTGLKASQFVQVLLDGKLSLFKSDIKLVSDVNQINAGVIKTFNNSSRYFIMKDNTLQLIKLNKKEVLDFVKDKESEIQSYITSQNLALKKEADLVTVLKYYNSL